MAASTAATEAVHLSELAAELGVSSEGSKGSTPDTLELLMDNKAAIDVAYNPEHHQRTKHIAKYYHYCRDLVLAGEIELVGVGTKYQVADIFTKPLERDTFRRLSSVLNGYRSYAQLLVDAPTASIATMLQKTSDYANQVYHSLADHDLARYV
mgnify:CR=1 FL=1